MTAVEQSSTPTTRKGSRLHVGPAALTVPAALGLVVFFAAPLVLFFVYSFLTARLYAVTGPLTLDATGTPSRPEHQRDPCS